MKEKYTIIFIPPDQSKSHQFQFSRLGRRVLGGGMLLMGVMITGLFAQNLYLSQLIRERQPTIEHIDQLNSKIIERDQEISHLNEMSNKITTNLKTIKEFEDKLSSILKINGSPSSSTVSRGMDTTALSVVSSNQTLPILDKQVPIVAKHLELIQRYYEAAVLQREQLERTPTMLPLKGEITSSFGYRRNPFGGRSTEYHNGIDIACFSGSPVLATAAGIVTFAERDSIYGLKVVIDHGHGIVTFYGHNSRLLVKKGDHVNKADLIAYSGNSGRSTGSHLHYGAMVNGKNVDPRSFITYTKKVQPGV